jgi:hypothetical protein
VHRGMPAGFLVDYLCAPALTGHLLALCLEQFRAQGAAAVYCLHLNAAAEGPLRAAGFLRRRSGWPLLVRPRGPAESMLLEARNWFLTAADSNVDRAADEG